MSVQYGKPIHGSNGEIVGYTADHDGDGTYDDFDPVVSNPINSGDGFVTHSSDLDGDGVYDDYTIYLEDDTTDSDTTDSVTTDPSRERDSSPSSYWSNLFSKKTWRIIGVVAAVLIGSSTLSWIYTLISGIVYYLFLK